MGRLASYDYGDIILQCARSEASRVHKGGRGTSEWKVDRQVADALVGHVLEESVGSDEQPAHERAWTKSDWLHKAGAEESLEQGQEHPNYELHDTPRVGKIRANVDSLNCGDSKGPATNRFAWPSSAQIVIARTKSS
jgi:hypothetical protein